MFPIIQAVSRMCLLMGQASSKTFKEQTWTFFTAWSCQKHWGRETVIMWWDRSLCNVVHPWRVLAILGWWKLPPSLSGSTREGAELSFSILLHQIKQLESVLVLTFYTVTYKCWNFRFSHIIWDNKSAFNSAVASEFITGKSPLQMVLNPIL